MKTWLLVLTLLLSTRECLAIGLNTYLSIVEHPPAQPEVILVRSSDPEKRASGVQWMTSGLKVVYQRWRDEVDHPYVYVRGSLTKGDWTVFLGTKRVLKDAHVETTQDFIVPVALLGTETPVDMVFIEGRHSSERESLLLIYPGWEKWLAENRVVRPYQILPGLGLSMISYTETKRTDYSLTAVTAKIAFNYLLSPKWNLGMSAFFTALPLSSSNPDAAVRYLGVNIKVGYKIPSIKPPWSISISAGSYYTTMFVGGNLSDKQLFGFQNLMGPQLFPVVQRTLENGDILMSYFKFSPVGAGAAVLSLKNREIGIGGAYTRKLTKIHSLSFTLDYANLSLDVTDDTIDPKTGLPSIDPKTGLPPEIFITNNSLTLGVAYSL